MLLRYPLITGRMHLFWPRLARGQTRRRRRTPPKQIRPGLRVSAPGL